MGTWKQETITTQWAWGHPATASGWEVTTRGSHGEGEGWTQTCREVWAVGSLDWEGCSGGGPTLCGEWQAPLPEDYLETECAEPKPVASRFFSLWFCLPALRSLLLGGTESCEPRSSGSLDFSSLLPPQNGLLLGRVWRHWDCQQTDCPDPLSLLIQYP
jgi:hypothetical protein